MFAVEVSDQIMIAHSFRGEVFGPAQALHDATFVVRAAFLSERLDGNGIVVDIGRAHEQLKAALDPLKYRNLDDLPQFRHQHHHGIPDQVRVRPARRRRARGRRARAARARSIRVTVANRRAHAPGTSALW